MINPYASPHTTADRDRQPVEEVPLLDRRVFLAWELLRIVYNAVLAVTCVMVLGFSDLLLTPELLFGAAFAALGANCCFFLGPATECYLRWLGLRAAWLRPALFLSGLVFSMLVTAVLAISAALAGF